MNEKSSPVGDTQDRLFAFLVALRCKGLSIPPNKQVDFFAGVEALSPTSLSELYWIGVAALVTSHTDQPDYDEVFDRFFAAATPTVGAKPQPGDELGEQVRGGHEAHGLDAESLGEAGDSGLLASGIGAQRKLRFAATTGQHREVLRQIRAELPGVLPRVRSRRWHDSRRHGRADLRSTYLRSQRTQGEIIDLRWRRRAGQQRRVLLLIDVSGSLKQHSADFLRFAYEVVQTADRAEVFTFGTQLTRVTPSLRRADVDEALAGLAEVVLDADGGTLIGESLQEFLGRARYLTVARGALVIVLSDGLERGDCAAMVAGVRRLRRLCHQLSWWTPLACDPSYQPLTRGMAAIRSEIDCLRGVRDLPTALEAVRTGFPDCGTARRKEAHV